jgi:hypothetical protein
MPGALGATLASLRHLVIAGIGEAGAVWIGDGDSCGSDIDARFVCAAFRRNADRSTNIYRSGVKAR